LEFSFDRSKEAHLQNAGNKPNPEKSAQSASEPVHSDGIDTSTITNERLRKAIEKNRARQAERSKMTQAPNEQASLFDKKPETVQQQAQQAAEERPEETPRARAQERTHVAPKTSTMATRKSVARADEADFTPVKRTPRKVASQISYTTTSRKKSKPLDPKLVGYLVKGCWLFCAVMILRLIFANGGVTDYYSQRSLREDRIEVLKRIKKENMILVREIERMKTDFSFQKKLVRDNLGFIAADEFLVLFPKEN
jgi:cell division protein FtsB